MCGMVCVCGRMVWEICMYVCGEWCVCVCVWVLWCRGSMHVVNGVCGVCILRVYVCLVNGVCVCGIWCVAVCVYVW